MFVDSNVIVVSIVSLHEGYCFDSKKMDIF